VSHSSIDRAANDVQLQERVKAATYKILYTDDECRSSIFGQTLLNSGSFGSSQLTSMYWAVAVATEAEYENAVADGNGSPGFDATVISDDTISQVVQGSWPMEQPPVAPPLPPT